MSGIEADSKDALDEALKELDEYLASEPDGDMLPALIKLAEKYSAETHGERPVIWGHA